MSQRPGNIRHPPSWKGTLAPFQTQHLGGPSPPFPGSKGSVSCCHSLQLSSLLFVSWLPPFSLFCPNEARIWIATRPTHRALVAMLLLCCCCQGLAVGLPSWEGAPGTTPGLNPGHQIVGGLSYISGWKGPCVLIRNMVGLTLGDPKSSWAKAMLCTPGNLKIPSGRCPGILSFFVLPKSSACSIRLPFRVSGIVSSWPQKKNLPGCFPAWPFDSSFWSSMWNLSSTLKVSEGTVPLHLPRALYWK